MQRLEQVRGAAESARGRVPEPVMKIWRWLSGAEFYLTSSSLAFYALISLPPMSLIALWAVSGFVDVDVLRQLGDEVSEGAPDEFEIGEVVAGLIETATSVGWVSVVTALWPASAYGAALAKAFGMIAPEAEREVQGWKGRLLALVLIAVLPLVVFAGIAVAFVVPQLLDVDGLAFQAMLVAAAALVYFLVVLAIYALFQVRDETTLDLVVGAALATGGQAVLTVGYLLYLVVGADFEETYGQTALAAVVLLGLYLLFSNAVLLSSYRYVLRRCRLREGPRTGGHRADDDAGPREAEPAEEVDAEIDPARR